MRRARRSQRNLLDEATRVAKLRADLRAKLTPLLQAALSEAVAVAPCQSKSDSLGSGKAGDDQKHA